MEQWLDNGSSKGNIALIGMMGSGKTSVGRVLAKRLGWRFVDVDQVIETKIGMPIPQIFSRLGERYFRLVEEKVTIDLVQQTRQVLATGGGAVTSARIRSCLWDNCTVVWLMARPVELARRVAQEPGTRPLLAGDDLICQLKDIYKQRRPYYEMAHIRIRTDGSTPEEIAERILMEIVDK